jgi:starch-binding outer membrane protein SusE/F
MKLSMKKLKFIYLLALAAVIMFGCEEDVDRVKFLGGTPPVLTASSTTDLVLTKAQENYSSLQFQWTNPEYEFSNGVNTQDVLYTLEVDTTGSNFSNPKAIAVNYTNDLSTSLKVRDLNNLLSGLELKDYMPHNFEFRVKATLANGSVPVYSNIVPIKITTYLDVVYPVPAKLYITGAATPAGWMGDGAAPVAAQEFTKINSYTFQISSLQINPNSGFLFVPVYGNWSNKYGFTGAGLANNTSGDAFKPDGSDFKSPADAGAYKVTVNFKTGKYSFEKL